MERAPEIGHFGTDEYRRPDEDSSNYFPAPRPRLADSIEVVHEEGAPRGGCLQLCCDGRIRCQYAAAWTRSTQPLRLYADSVRPQRSPSTDRRLRT